MTERAASRMTFAVTGESLCTRRHSCYRDAPFLQLVELLRQADVAQTNLETRIHTFRGYPMPVDTMGASQSYQQADPFVADELRWMGFNMIARSNNHGMDYGPEMVREEGEILDAAGLVHAGAGVNLAAATQPVWLETNNGRAALISLCTDFPPHCPAGEQRPDMQGRPGINALHFDVDYPLEGDDFAALQRIAERLGPGHGVRGDKILAFGQVFFRAGQTASRYTARQSDVERNVRAIGEAKRAADFVIVHIHHSTRTGHRPAERIQQLARALIDAGADIIVGDGPHVLQGIEVYRGRPIFYSLGNFFYQSETIKRFPADFYERSGLDATATPQDVLDVRDAIRSGKRLVDKVQPTRTGDAYMKWFEALLGQVVFDGDKLAEIVLHPIWNYHERRSQRGLPRLAPEEHAQRILHNIADYSREWGTRIAIDGNRGRILLR